MVRNFKKKWWGILRRNGEESQKEMARNFKKWWGILIRNGEEF